MILSSDSYLAIIKTIYHSKRFYDNSSLTQAFAAMLECLFYYKSHARKLCSSLPNKIYYTHGGVAVGKKIVNEQQPITPPEKLTAGTDVIRALFGERVDFG